MALKRPTHYKKRNIIIVLSGSMLLQNTSGLNMPHGIFIFILAPRPILFFVFCSDSPTLFGEVATSGVHTLWVLSICSKPLRLPSCLTNSPFCLHLCFLLSMFSFIWQLGMSCVFSGFTCFPSGQVSCCLKDGLCLHSDRHISVTFASSDAVIFVFAFVCVFVFVIVLHHSDQVK